MEISEALKNIRYGYIAALVSAGITVVLNFLQFDAGDVNLFSDPVVLYDVIIILLLAFGIYKKSRVCAIAMFIYFILGKIFQFQEYASYGIDTPPSTYLVAVVFIYFYFQAVRGTIAFHKINKKN
tara:strand:+ start:143 stop:517 length:375 start_codon:yes stop_codon:yes gene_type:complete